MSPSLYSEFANDTSADTGGEKERQRTQSVCPGSDIEKAKICSSLYLASHGKLAPPLRTSFEAGLTNSWTPTSVPPMAIIKAVDKPH